MNHRIAKFFTCECEAHEDAKLGPSASTHSAGHNAKFEVSFGCRSACPTDSQQVSSQSQSVRKKLSSCTTIVVRIKVEQSTHTALERRNNLHAEVWRTLTGSVTNVALHLRDERDRERRHIDQRARHREHGNVTSPCALFSVQVCPHHCAATSMIIQCGPSTSLDSVIRISSLRNIKCTLRECIGRTRQLKKPQKNHSNIEQNSQRECVATLLCTTTASTESTRHPTTFRRIGVVASTRTASESRVDDCETHENGHLYVN